MISRSILSGSGATSTRLNRGAMYSSSLKRGTRIDRRDAGTRGMVSVSITEGADPSEEICLAQKRRRRIRVNPGEPPAAQCVLHRRDPARGFFHDGLYRGTEFRHSDG